MDIPEVKTVSLALRSGEILELDNVQTTELDFDRGLYRVQWRPMESIAEAGKILYRKRWEGSRRSLEATYNKLANALKTRLLEIIP